jgi:hypothetical protein
VTNEPRKKGGVELTTIQKMNVFSAVNVNMNGHAKSEQDCQSFLATTNQNGKTIQKLPPKIPNGRNMHQNSTKNNKWRRFMYTNIFHPKL